MRTTIFICLATFGLFVGCQTYRPLNDDLPGPRNVLLLMLRERDDKPVDLIVIGHKLINEYGKRSAEGTVLSLWYELTCGEHASKASDVLWLQEQPPRVRDTAWLVRYRSEWLK